MLAKVPDLKSLFFLPFSRSTPRQRRDEDCFDVDLDNIHGKEFDFERNLALFDKKCVLEEIESNQPDVVRLIDHNRRGGTKTKTTTVSFTSFFKKNVKSTVYNIKITIFWREIHCLFFDFTNFSHTSISHLVIMFFICNIFIFPGHCGYNSSHCNYQCCCGKD